MTWTDLVRAALQNPQSLRTEHPDAQPTARLLVVGALTAAIAGAVVGTHRGGLQIAFAAVKLPFVLLLPVIVTMPTLLWIRERAGVPSTWAQSGREGAIVVARMGCCLLMFAPLMRIAWATGGEAFLAVRILVLMMACAFLVGTHGTYAELGHTRARWAAVGLVAMALGQTSWMLRPFISQPAQEVRLFRGMNGNFVEGILDPYYADRDPIPTPRSRARDAVSTPRGSLDCAIAPDPTSPAAPSQDGRVVDVRWVDSEDVSQTWETP